jgi:hypothetical protein
MKLDGLEGDYAGCYKAAVSICSILCDICNYRPTVPFTYLEFCQPFLAPFIHGLTMDQHRTRTRFQDIILRHLVVEWRGWLVALCRAVIVAGEGSSEVADKVMKDLCALHIQLFRCRRQNAEMTTRYRLSGSCMWILSTVWIWAISVGNLIEVMQVTSILDQVHQNTPDERDTTPIETLLSGTCAIIHWLEDQNTLRDFTILSSFIIHSRYPLGHLLLMNGFLPPFCRLLYSHISRLPINPSPSHFLKFKLSFAVLRHFIEVTGPDFLSRTSKKLVPSIWCLVKWSTLYDVPTEVKEEGVYLIMRVTGMTVYYSVLRDIQRYVRRHHFETRFPNVRNPDPLQQAWMKLYLTVKWHEHHRKEFIRIPQFGCLNVCPRAMHSACISSYLSFSAQNQYC